MLEQSFATHIPLLMKTSGLDLDYGEDATVLLNGATCTISIHTTRTELK